MSIPTAKPALPATARLARKLALGSMLALAAGLSSPAAQAQSFDAIATVTSGTAVISTGLSTTQIDINSDEVVVDWVPNDTGGIGTINFQSAGSTATFDTDISSPLLSYTVLNRILPQDDGGTPTARAVQFNGLVQSLAQGAPGGNIWFYSPTGIIIGPTATFNTGSLVLTTDDIDVNGGLFGPGSTIRFRGAAGSTGFVDINAGASLNAALQPGDYLAIVASRVVQSGNISVDGQIALVAAEQVDIAINAGLLDIVVL